MKVRSARKRPPQFLKPNSNSASSSRAGRYLFLATCALVMCFFWFSSGQKAFAESNALLSSTISPPDQKPVSVLIPAYLDATLDSKKRNTGDQIEAKTAAPTNLADGTVIPRGAKLVGHVTGSKARSKGDSESSLTIVFDKVTMVDGKTMNIKGYLQAIAPNPNMDQGGGGVDYGTSLNRSMEHAGAGETSHAAIPILNAQSVGVAGIKDLALDGDGVLTSPGKAVKLDHGSQMLVRAQLVAQ